MLAKNVNDYEGCLDARGALRFFASKLAPTNAGGHVVNAPLRGVHRHLTSLRQPYHRIKGPLRRAAAPTIRLAHRRRWERRDVQQARPDPGL
ncbi:hypothetical protein C0058_29995 [Pseudomonas sp. NC02]|nr:hypothetical protein C0058_29995 [Pseudomonas sp. NC02]